MSGPSGSVCRSIRSSDVDGPPRQKRDAAGPEDVRRDVQPDEVHDALRPTRPRGSPRLLRGGAIPPGARPARRGRHETSGPLAATMTAPRASSGSRSAGFPAAAADVMMMTGPRERVESTAACAGVRSRRSKITRVSGRSRKAPRAVSCGSSVRMVPAPTPMASTSARSAWACRLAAAEVSAVRRPCASARQPSRLIAAFRMTNGRRSRISVRNGWLSTRAADAPRPTSTWTPCARRCCEALAVDERIRILDRGDQARNAGLDDLRDARTGASDVAARLERAVHRRAARARARLLERQHLGVRLAGAPVEALPDDHAVAGHDHGPHERIRTRAAAAPARPETTRGPCSPASTTSLRTARSRTRRRKTARGRPCLRPRRRSESAASGRSRWRPRRRPWRSHRAWSGRCRSRRRRS